MKKFMRRIATVSVSAALAGGVLLATGGSATAATPRDHRPAPAPTRVVVIEDTKTIGLHGVHQDRGDHAHTGTHRGASDRFDPWVADQLLVFEPWIADQLAMFEPWIEGQLAIFVHPGGLDHRHFVND
ncbi:hypothetical protein SRB17_79880 [Streptomyces sp. RB17]|uniref:hypothetical protein n=1 Tax=Streptomyces sp. RB17 TaxID=2585197 RepID=UPI0012980F3A|nr:hypothetical protein [Streptomyces sp. RB17]MQY39959.1 hypothetical protein [Streptomyces sp. RB17]